MKKIKNVIPFLGINILAFYLLPFLIKDTWSWIFVLLFFIPSIVFFSSFFYWIKNWFCLLYAILTAILFIPTIFIYYNESAWIYTAIFWTVALVWNLVGILFYKK